MVIEMIYDSQMDMINFVSASYEDGCHSVSEIAIPREEFLQRLLEISYEWGHEGDVFHGRFAGETEFEPTELTFLQPPTEEEGE